MNSVVLITGASGFVGRHLTKYLLENSITPVLMPDTIDIRNQQDVTGFCSKHSFDYVVHLAAQSFVPRSITNPRETYDINFIGTLNLLESLKLNNFSGTFLFVGSSDVYGIVSDNCIPIKESCPVNPVSPYAVSKSAAELICRQWSVSQNKIRILITRSFNHIGPYQDDAFVISSFCKQVAMINHGIQCPNIAVGNLEVSRDFTDVRDVVRAYVLLLEKGVHGKVYNICSGKEVLLKNILPKLRKITGVDFGVKISSGLYRDVEQVRVFGSFKLINKDTGWMPKISLDQSLMDIYNYWINKKDI